MDIQVPTIPQAVVIGLPLLVAAITGLLGHQTIPPWANAVIAGLFVVGGAILSIVLGQGFSNNLALDFIFFASYSAALISSPILKPLLDRLLASTPSPLQAVFKPAPQVTTAQGNASRAVNVGPKPIVFPPASAKPPEDMGG